MTVPPLEYRPGYSKGARVILVKRRYVVALCVVVAGCALGLTAWVFTYARYLRSPRFAADIEKMLADT